MHAKIHDMHGRMDGWMDTDGQMENTHEKSQMTDGRQTDNQTDGRKNGVITIKKYFS